MLERCTFFDPVIIKVEGKCTSKISSCYTLGRTLVDSICEPEYRSGRISEVGFLTACTERSEILKASGIHPTMM